MIYKLRWDKNEKDFMYFLKLIPDGDCILDIGANIGVMSVHFAKTFKRSVVYAIEPISENILTINRIRKLFKLQNLQICSFALGNENKNVTMLMPVEKNVKLHGLAYVKENESNGIEYRVEMKTLDEWFLLLDVKSRISAIKIDVENSELAVLEGGFKRIFKDNPLIYCELWDNQQRSAVFELIKKLNYNIFVLIKNKLVLFDQNKHQKQNFFFIPKEENK